MAWTTYSPTSFTTGSTYDPWIYTDIDNERELRRREREWQYEKERRRREYPCASCGLTHGPSQMYGNKCEITIVKEMEAREAKEKKHNENIRKLYWERYITRGR